MVALVGDDSVSVAAKVGMSLELLDQGEDHVPTRYEDQYSSRDLKGSDGFQQIVDNFERNLTLGHFRHGVFCLN